MNDKVYENCQYLALGILAGYFGLYAWDWVKSWKKEAVPNQKNSEPKQAQKETQTN